MIKSLGRYILMGVGIALIVMTSINLANIMPDIISKIKASTDNWPFADIVGYAASTISCLTLIYAGVRNKVNGKTLFACLALIVSLFVPATIRLIKEGIPGLTTDITTWGAIFVKLGWQSLSLGSIVGYVLARRKKYDFEKNYESDFLE